MGLVPPAPWRRQIDRKLQPYAVHFYWRNEKNVRFPEFFRFPEPARKGFSTRGNFQEPIAGLDHRISGHDTDIFADPMFRERLAAPWARHKRTRAGTAPLRVFGSDKLRAGGTSRSVPRCGTGCGSG